MRFGSSRRLSRRGRVPESNFDPDFGRPDEKIFARPRGPKQLLNGSELRDKLREFAPLGTQIVLLTSMFVLFFGRSGWAVLATGALIASLLAVGASPAGAQPLSGAPNAEANNIPDQLAETKACVGDALGDQMFTDVSDAHAFKDGINCIAYYGITNGTGDGATFSPNDDVTRAEMAVFIARAADAAGVDLGDAMDEGFTDIGDIWQEAQDAINSLASKGMIPAGGEFRPGDAITRAEMATFLIGLLAEASSNVAIDSEGRIELGTGPFREPAVEARDQFDWFADARGAVPSGIDEAISALYELGVTMGTEQIAPSPPPPPRVLVTMATTVMISNPVFSDAADPSTTNPRAILNPQGSSLVSPQQLSFNDEGQATFSVNGLPDGASHQKQDKSDVDIWVQVLAPGAASGAPKPLNVNYDPHGTVNRGEMAEFITRALAHTPVRPAGVSAQYVGPSDEVVVSVRTETFEPVPNTTVDLFKTDTPGEDLAFNRDGSCNEVAKLDPNQYECEIDNVDLITGSDGDGRTALGGVDDGGTLVWAWTGETDEELDEDTNPYRLSISEAEASRPATQIAVGTEFIGTKAHQGASIPWTLQLLDKDGNPTNVWSSQACTTTASDRCTPVFVNDKGVELARKDTTVDANTPYSQFRVLDNTADTSDGAGTNSETFIGVFSTERSIDTNTNSDITVSVSPADEFIAADDRGASTRVTVSVTDQYGDPITGVKVQLATDRATPASQLIDGESTIRIANNRYLAVGSDGSYTFGYERSGIDTSESETLTATLEAWDHDGDAATAELTQTGTGNIEWAHEVTSGESGDDDQIVEFDKDTNTIFVDPAVGTDDDVLVMYYDSNDRFNITEDGATEAATYSLFEKALSKRTGYLLTWDINGAGARAVNGFTLTIPAS